MANVYQTVKADFKRIVENAPEGKIAMFEITCIPSSMDDSWLGQYIYGTRKGRLIDVYTHKFVPTPAGLIFVKYATKDW